MNSKVYLALFAILCVAALVHAQSTTNPIQSLQSKASAIAASATNTSPSAPSSTSAATNLASNVFLQLAFVACVFVASTFYA